MFGAEPPAQRFEVGDALLHRRKAGEEEFLERTVGQRIDDEHVSGNRSGLLHRDSV